MNIGKDHTIKVIATTVAKDVEKAITQWLSEGIPPDVLGQVGDDEKFELAIRVEPAGMSPNKLGFCFAKSVSILKSLVKK